jgi:carbon starvation protein CstA
MAVYYNFMTDINFIVSVITLSGILVYSYLREKKKIFLYLLIPVLLLSFFNETYTLFNNLEKQSPNQNEIVQETYSPETNETDESQNKVSTEIPKNSENRISVSKQDEFSSSQAPQDLMIYLSLILLVALITLLWVFFYHKMYENKKALLYSAISMFFIVLSIFTILAFDFSNLKPYNPQDGTGLTEEEIQENIVYRTILKKQNNIDSVEDYSNLNFEEKFSVLKIIENVIRFYLLTTLIILSIIAIIIIKSKRAKSKKHKTNKEIKKEKQEVYSNKGIYLIDEGYKFIRNNFYFQYSYLTPYELIETVPVSNEFIELTNLFVKKEYGSKNVDYSDEQIKKLIDAIINQLKEAY